MNEKKYPVVSSARDPRFLDLRSLQTHQGRSRTNLFIIEGIRHLARAVEHCTPIESIFLDPSVLSNPFAKNSLADFVSTAFPVFVFRASGTVI
jgi:hypothetical protein